MVREQGHRGVSGGKTHRAPVEEFRARRFGGHVGSKERPRTATADLEPASAAQIRRSAIDRLRHLAESESMLVASVVPVLLQALGDPRREIRLAASDHLQVLGLDATFFGAEAVGSGSTDVGTRGLELLSDARNQGNPKTKRLGPEQDPGAGAALPSRSAIGTMRRIPPFEAAGSSRGER